MEIDARFVIRYYLIQGDGFGFGGLDAGNRAFVYSLFPYGLLYIRVPFPARRAFAYPFGRFLSAVAAHVNRLFFCHISVPFYIDCPKVRFFVAEVAGSRGVFYLC